MPVNAVLRSIHYSRHGELTDPVTQNTQTQVKKTLSPHSLMDDVLSVGDQVALYCEDSHGYVFNFTSSSMNNGVRTFCGQDKVNPDNITDPQGITFEILLKNRYKSQKHLEKYRKQAEKSAERLREMEKAAKSEAHENVLEQRRNKGARLRYGQVIQLRHQFTEKYLHIRTTLTSKRDKNYMAVELYDYNAKQAQFKVLPRYKVKSEGDLVQLNDQIVLESVKSPLQFLHVSSPANIEYTGAGSTEVQGNRGQFCEVNLGVQKSGFTIIRYRQQGTNKVVKGGAVVRLYHKEQESYLVAQGYLNRVTQQCHLRTRNLDASLPKHHPTSGVTYWQLEHLDSIVNGSPLKWEQRVLVRHMVTRHYLAVDNSGSLTMTPNRSQPDVVFRLHCVTRDSIHIEYGSYTRVQHALTGKWFHATQEDFITSSPPNEHSLNLPYDAATKKVIHAETSFRYDDAFILQEVCATHVEQFNFLAGIMPCVLHLKQDVTHRPLNQHDVQHFTRLLDELADFLIVEREPVEVRQKLLRNLMIVDQLIDILQIVDLARFGVKTICEKIYRVLENYLKGNNRKNELYIARHMKTFSSHMNKQISVGETALSMVIELVRDNRHIVDTLGCDKEEYILHYIKLLESCKDYRYLEMLSVFCVCDGFTLSENQTYITQHWLDQGRNTLYLTEMGRHLGKDPNLVYMSTDQGTTWRPLHHFCTALSHTKTPEYLFLESQLTLFEKLCAGRNQYAIDVITTRLQYLGREEALHCLQDEHLPHSLRATYCRLIITLFVDVQGAKCLVDQTTLSFEYKQLNGRKIEFRYSRKSFRHSQCTSLYNPEFSDCLHSNTVMSILRQWIATFLKGHSNMKVDWEGTRLIEQVLSLVAYLVRFGQYTEVEDILELKTPLLLLLGGKNGRPLAEDKLTKSSGISLAQSSKPGRFQATPNNKVIVAVKLRAMEVVDLLLTLQSNRWLELFMGIFKHCYQHRDNKNESPLAGFMTGTQEDMSDTKLRELSAKVIEDLNKAVCLFPRKEMVDILLDLSDYQSSDVVTQSISLLIKCYSLEEELFTTAVQGRLLLTSESCELHQKVKDSINTLKRLSRAKLNAEQAHTLQGILDDMASYCSLEDDPDEVHEINQLILINFGIPDVVRHLLQQGVGSKALKQPNLKTVIVSALGLLRVLVRGNEYMQKFTFSLCEDILQLQEVECQAASALTQVFTDHTENCLTVSPQLIQRIVDLTTTLTEEVPELLDLLCAIVKLEELNEPLKRNQDLVIKYVMENYGRIGHLFDKTERDSILQGQNGQKQQTYLLSLVNLLALCAEGVNRFTESLCQTLQPLEDITDVLNNRRLDSCLKGPYLKLLMWAHVHTTAGMSHTTSQLSQNITGYLESLSEEAFNMKECIKNNPDVTVAFMHQPPSKRVTFSREHPISASVHYFLDAILPFVGVFYKELNFDEVSLKFKIISTDMAHSLLDFAEVVPLSSLNRYQKSALKSGLHCMIQLVSRPEKYAGLLEKCSYTHNAITESVSKYRQEYQREILINKQLNKFTENLQTAYRGPNTVKDQLGHSSKTAYITEDEELPLGQDFQQLVNCFKPENYKRATRLLDQLHTSSTSLSTDEKESAHQVAVDVKCLQILRALIHNELCKGRSGSNKDRVQLTVSNIQNTLLDHGAVHKTMPLLQHSDSNLVREYFAFASALLYGLNSRAQDAFRDCSREEVFFFTMKERIHLSTQYTQEKRNLAAQYEARSQREAALDRSLRETITGRRQASVEQSFLIANPSLLEAGHTAGSSIDRNNNVKRQTDSPSNPNEFSDIYSKTLTNDLDQVEIKDQGYIELMLKMMACMCDGQHSELQDLLREQPDNYKSANLVGDVTGFLNLLYCRIQDCNIDLVTQVFVTLNEFASGNTENQFVIYEQHIVEYVNYILRASLDGVSPQKKLGLWSAICCLMMSIVEEQHPEKSQLLTELASILDKESLSRVAVYWKKEFTKDMHGQPGSTQILTELAVNVGFQYYFLLMKLKDLGSDIQEHTLETEDEEAAFQWFRHNHKSIEVLKDNHVQVLRFRLREKYVLRESVKERLKWTIDRSTPTSKLRGLMNWSNDILKEINHEKNIQSFLPVRYVTNRWELWNNLVILLSLILCVLMLVAWDAKASMADLPSVGEVLLTANSSLYDPVPDYPAWFSRYLTILGGMHMSVSVLILIVFFITNPPRFHPITSIKHMYSRSTLFGLKDSEKVLRKSHKSDLRVDLFSFTTFYHLALVVFSFLGFYYHGYFFAFHLLNIVYNNQLLRRVILAVTLNGRSLLWVALLGLIIIFQFSLVAFAHFRYAMDPDGPESTLYCGDLVQCTVTLLRYGLVGDLFEKMAVYQSERSFHAFGILAAYHIAFFILITTVGLNIVFGIILDTFSQLRHAKWIAERDMKEQCFICSQPAHLFESHAKGFHHHVKCEHSMWAYIFFFIHLNDTERADLTHLELYVERLRIQGRFDFFPVNRALSLSVDNDDKTEKLDEILSKLQAVIERSEKEDSQREREQERQQQEQWEREHRQGGVTVTEGGDGV